jgi:hypothetical protein
VPGYIVASLIACINLLFVVLLALLLSLVVSEVAAFLGCMGIGVAGAIIDGVSLVGGRVGKVPALSDLSVSRIVSYAWPKLSAVEHFASSFIGGGGHQSIHTIASVYPLFNITVYCFVIWVFLIHRFGKEELS